MQEEEEVAEETMQQLEDLEVAEMGGSRLQQEAVEVQTLEVVVAEQLS